MSLLAEVICFTLLFVCHPNSQALRFSEIFHRPAGMAVDFFVPGLEDEASIPQDLDADIAALIFLVAAFVQWFIIFLGGFMARRYFVRARHATNVIA